MSNSPLPIELVEALSKPKLQCNIFCRMSLTVHECLYESIRNAITTIGVKSLPTHLSLISTVPFLISHRQIADALTLGTF